MPGTALTTEGSNVVQTQPTALAPVGSDGASYLARGLEPQPFLVQVLPSL